MASSTKGLPNSLFSMLGAQDPAMMDGKVPQDLEVIQTFKLQVEH